ncbi:peroxisomal membrane protein PEX14 [Podospora australis]|uniref:Peroxisomal membrane protein PEX14 n=1 Tax=Podospora australis TaxID=1536484 RepID=A0AAN6WN38_9PEZI|nr:peroxisomal membrane protein PEX14 [Podospora australis]
MSDVEKKQPESQLAQADTTDPDTKAPESQPEPEQTRETTLDQARKFLQDPETQKATPETRTEFLKSKGLSESDIQQLLKEVSQDAPTPAPQQSVNEDKAAEESLAAATAAFLRKEDRPPIVTYPEFLTKPARPPPLVTVNGFLNTLYAFGGLSTVIYGTSKYILEPMVSTLTEARISLHDTAKDDATKLVAKLEKTVSEVPVYKHSHTDDDAVSHYDDPAELFHRDVGVQTSPPGSALASPGLPSESAAALHTRRLKDITSSLKQLNEGLVSQSEGYADVKVVLDVFQDELDALNAAQMTDFVGGYNLYGVASKNEPDDEIKKAKDNIRRVKGVLLSSRSFPGSASVR